MSARTIYLSRLIGLYCILDAACLAIHKQAIVDAVAAMYQSPAVMLVLGIITLAVGLAMVLGHNIWSGGPQVVVTLVGWISLLKGLNFLALPLGGEEKCILSWLRDPVLFYVCLVPSFLIGIYLTWEGFRPRATS